MSKTKHIPIAVLFSLLLPGAVALAGEPVLHEEHVIKIKTSGAEVFEADLTELAVGEARSFVSASGQAIELIRTADGAEVYIDGELVDIGAARLGGDHHVLHREVKVECLTGEGGEADCDHDAVFIGDAAGGDVQVMRKHFEVVCDGDTECQDMVWVDADGDFEYAYESLEDAAGDDHQVIVIRKHHAETFTEE